MIHDHDTWPGALVQLAVVIATPRGNDERKYPRNGEWQPQDEWLMIREDFHVALCYWGHNKRERCDGAKDINRQFAIGQAVHCPHSEASDLY
jgi:hypothetical protein